MKTQIMWAIKNKSGYLFAFNETRHDAMREGCDTFGEETWKMAKRKFGLSAVRVKVDEIAPVAKQGKK